MTLFEGVRILRAGHYLEVESTGPVHSRPFFTLTSFAGSASAEASVTGPSRRPRDLVRLLDELLHVSVRKHMIADVEVGSLCSGGLDSSLITALAARYNPNIVLFHADVLGRKSERRAAEQLARYLKLDLLCVPVDDQLFLSLIPETVRHYEAPFSYHPNSVPFLAAAHLVRRHGIKAILSGEGADEGFLGYSAVRRQVLAGRYRSLFGTLIGRGSRREHGLSGGDLLGRLERQVEEQAIANVTGVTDPIALGLLGYHLRTLLHRNDRLGMAAGIEARFPFLDHDVVAFAVNTHPKYKVRMGLSRWARTRNPFIVKWLLRKVAEQYLPVGLAYRRKRGFPTTTLRRLQIDNSFFRGSWLWDELELTRRQLEVLLARAPQSLRVRLMLCEVWARLFLACDSIGSVRERLLASTTVQPE